MSVAVINNQLFSSPFHTVRYLIGMIKDDEYFEVTFDAPVTLTSKGDVVKVDTDRILKHAYRLAPSGDQIKYDGLIDLLADMVYYRQNGGPSMYYHIYLQDGSNIVVGTYQKEFTILEVSGEPT